MAKSKVVYTLVCEQEDVKMVVDNIDDYLSKAPIGISIHKFIGDDAEQDLRELVTEYLSLLIEGKVVNNQAEFIETQHKLAMAVDYDGDLHMG